MGGIFDVIKGFLIGIANTIPGVSGGTIALLLGIFERLLSAIKSINTHGLKQMFQGLEAFRKEFQRIDGWFIVRISLGVSLAIFSFAGLMKYLLLTYHDPTYGFFLGLVLASLIVPYQMIQKRTWKVYFLIFVGAFSVWGTSQVQSPDDRYENAIQKAQIQEKKQTVESNRSSIFSLNATPTEMMVFFGAGAVSMVAMILPGISGSFVLLLIGVYFEFLDAIINFKILLLGLFALGGAIGILASSRVLSHLLRVARDGTLAFLTGLVLGSLFSVWPFQRFATVAGKRVDLENIFPSIWGVNELLTIVFAFIGFFLVLFFIQLEKKNRNKQEIVIN